MRLTGRASKLEIPGNLGGVPKGLADPGELSALTRRSGNPSCKASVSRAHDGIETVRSPVRAAQRNYVAADGGEGWIRTNVDGVADRSISPLCHFAWSRDSRF